MLSLSKWLINKSMEELYRYVHIPNFEEIQRELIESINYDYSSQGLHAQNFTEEYMTEKCPKLMNWLKVKSKSKFRLLRFYFTPGHAELLPHIDSSFITVPFGLNIPVLNCHNTKMTWYHCSKENQSLPVVKNGYLQGVCPIDPSKLEIIEELELTKPCFVKGDVMHGVKNFNNTVRIMFTVRWGLHPIKFRSIDEVMDITDLFA
jgi:hypothetical protein